MKKFVLLAVFALASGFGLRAQDDDNIPTFLKVSEAVHDYGTIDKGADPYCQFTITNISKHPVTIDTANGSCGCTVPEYAHDVPIQPGKSSVIKVKYDTQRVGPFEKTVTVRFEGETETLVLKIKGKVQLPPSDMPFGSQPLNNGAPLERGN